LSPSLPGLRFRIFDFPVTIGVDFLLISVLLGLGQRPGLYLIEWVVVVAVSILIHELGHAFALRHYSVRPEIRLWGMGGLTMSGFALPPRKSILVSLAGPCIGIPVALAVMVIRPWLPQTDPLWTITNDLVAINLFWGLINLLPLGGLDGGNVVTNLFLLWMGERGRRPGQVLVAISSLVIAFAAAAVGFVYLTVVILFFAIFNPEPYFTLWNVISGKRQAPLGGGLPSLRMTGSAPMNDAKRAKANAKLESRRGKNKPAAVVATETRRVFGEVYAEVVMGGPATDADLAELENRPAPLLPDVIGMVTRRDDATVASRLASETDPLAVLGILARVVDAARVSQVREALARGGAADRTPGLLKMQVGLYALGRFEDSIAAAAALGPAGGSAGAILEARSAARLGDRKRTTAALERAIELGAGDPSEAALGDLARVGPDDRVGAALARLRSASPRA
jgi:Zn-dependent protease